MGFGEVYVVRGGTSAWTDAGRALEAGPPPSAAERIGEALSQAPPRPAADPIPDNAAIIHVGLSAEFARSHVPASHWVPRGWLETRISDAAPDKTAPLIATCEDGAQSALAAATLAELGYDNVSILAGGMTAWRDASLPIETGLSGVMSPPNDAISSGAERNYADMVNYLRWEEELGHKYAR